MQIQFPDHFFPCQPRYTCSLFGSAQDNTETLQTYTKRFQSHCKPNICHGHIQVQIVENKDTNFSYKSYNEKNSIASQHPKVQAFKNKARYRLQIIKYHIKNLDKRHQQHGEVKDVLPQEHDYLPSYLFFSLISL